MYALGFPPVLGMDLDKPVLFFSSSSECYKNIYLEF